MNLHFCVLIMFHRYITLPPRPFPRSYLIFKAKTTLFVILVLYCHLLICLLVGAVIFEQLIFFVKFFNLFHNFIIASNSLALCTCHVFARINDCRTLLKLHPFLMIYSIILMFLLLFSRICLSLIDTFSYALSILFLLILICIVFFSMTSC